MRTLRLVAAKGQQKAIVVYWGTLQTGIADSGGTEIIWKDHNGDKFPPRTTALRYLLRFALVDVNSGSWSMYLPVVQAAGYQKSAAFNDGTSDLAQAESLKQRAYAEAARGLAENFAKAASSPGRS